MQGTVVGLNTARQGSSAVGKAQGDDVSLWGSSTFDEHNAGSGSDDAAAAGQGQPVKRGTAASRSGDTAVAKKAQQAGDDRQTRSDQQAPASDDADGGRTPKRSFYAMLTGQGRPRTSPQPAIASISSQAAAAVPVTALLPHPDPLLSPDQQQWPAAVTAATAGGPRALRTVPDPSDSDDSSSDEQSGSGGSSSRRHNSACHSGDSPLGKQSAAGYEAIIDADAASGSDSSSVASEDGSPPRPVRQEQKSPLHRSPVPLLRLSAISNQLEQQEPGAAKESSSPVAAAAVKEQQVQPAAEKREAPAGKGQRLKLQQHVSAPAATALRRSGLGIDMR